MERAGSPGRPGDRLRAAGPVAGDLRAARRAVRGPRGASSDRTGRLLDLSAAARGARGGAAGVARLHGRAGRPRAGRARRGHARHAGARARRRPDRRRAHRHRRACCCSPGTRPPSNMLGLGTLALLRHPEQLALLRDGARARSTPRWRSCCAGSAIVHSGTVEGAPPREVEIAGTPDRRAGELVFCALPAANRDPALLADPDRLDVTPGRARPRRLRARRAPLPGRAAGPHGDADRLPRPARPLPRPARDRHRAGVPLVQHRVRRRRWRSR